MPKILIVEDNELNRDMLSRRLIRKGYEIDMAFDGLECLSVVNERRPDLILMDMGLPVMTGWEAAKALKGNPETAAIPIIALTAHAMSSDRDEAVNAGCNDFDTKPVDLNRLLEKMTALLP